LVTTPYLKRQLGGRAMVAITRDDTLPTRHDLIASPEALLVSRAFRLRSRAHWARCVLVALERPQVP